MTYPPPRRSSIFAGLLLVLIGALFLIHNVAPGLLQVAQIARYWPVLLILWGLAIFWDRVAARRSGQIAPRTVSGSDLLLVLLVLVGVAAFISYDHLRRTSGGWDGGIDLFNNSYTFTNKPPSVTVSAGNFIDLSTPRGDISVRAQDQPQLNVVVTKIVSAPSRDDAQKLADSTTVNLQKTPQGWQVSPQIPSGGDRVEVGYDVSLLPQTSLSATTGHGDIHVTGIGGEVTTSSSGEVEISRSGGNASIDLRHGDLHVESATGNVTVNGRGEQIDIAEIGGSASINGEFYGPIRVRHVAKAVQFNSRRTSFTAVTLPGELEMDSGQLTVSDTTGNVSLDTRDKDITFENVQGKLRITDRNGSVVLRFSQPPQNNIEVTNSSGDVDLVLPDRSSFTLNAVARSGDISSDFQSPSLKLVEASSNSALSGTVGSGGPSITLNTSYGTIHIRHTAAAPPTPPPVPSPPSTPRHE